MPMDHTKKRKSDENGSPEVSKEDMQALLETLSKEQIVDLLQDAALRHSDVLKDVRKAADEDPTPRKIFVRGLGWDTKGEAMKKVFAKYGEVEEAVVVTDRKTQKGRGYGFVTFAHVDSAIRALKDPNKTVEGRVTSCNPASQGTEHAKVPPEDVTHRKIYVSNVPEEMTADKLHKFFAQYGEIAEGPLGFHKSGKSKGYSLIIYKTLDGAKQALQDPLKNLDGHRLRCKLAEGGPKVKDSEESKEGGATSAPLSIPSSVGGGLGGYALPYVTYDPSVLQAGVALNPGLTHMLSNPLTHGLKPVGNLSSLGLGASLNSSLSIDPSLAASLYPSLSSLSSDSMAQGFLSGVGHGLHPAGSSLGLASLGAHSGGLAAYPAQLAAYTRLATAPLYDAGTSSTSQAAGNPGSSISSYAAHLGATPAERAQIAGALGTLAAYYDR
ncbi:hypothetical protein O6H91_07G074900 [Diphasiastrum complanatum]|uniref:Uncharacterized protein n=1 Tax=Diphasiastrum complanatum TaxID=34168 RepID=A0ACC2D6N1_DIPCM|nr:hypothetical protein O6H91_07G074900 [Diphasiastrum complanatum]